MNEPVVTVSLAIPLDLVTDLRDAAQRLVWAADPEFQTPPAIVALWAQQAQEALSELEGYSPIGGLTHTP